MANPANVDAVVEVRHLRDDGEVLTKSCTVSANSRVTIAVNGEDFAGGVRALAHGNISMIVTSINGIPVVAERAMWFPRASFSKDFRTEAHSSLGSPTTATRWILAEGEEAGRAHSQTFVLVANTSPSEAHFRVTVLFPSDPPIDRTYIAPANSRTTIPVAAYSSSSISRGTGT